MIRPTLFLLIAAAIAAPSPAKAASGPPGDIKATVDGFLERFPANDAAARDSICAEILRLGPAAVREICGRVLPPEQGDDTKARFGLNALAIYVTRPGAELERRQFAKGLLKGLEVSPTVEAKVFLISQVQLAGKEEAVGPLARYLRDGRLAEPVVQALLAIRGRAAARVLLKALGPAPPAVRPALIKALGELRSREAVKKLLPYAESPDAATRTTALFALANIGHPGATGVFRPARAAVSDDERTPAPSLHLLYARRLAESGDSTEALAIARSVLARPASDQESHVASQALSLLVSVLKENALSDLLAVMDSGDPELRGAALELATGLGSQGATAAWIQKAEASPPGKRAEIVSMLGRRKDREALAFVRRCLTDPEKEVRTAAIPAVARLGGETVLPDLFALVAFEGEPGLAVLKDTLLGFSKTAVVPEAARRLEETSGPGRAVLVSIIGEKAAREEIGRAYELADDPNPAVRSAAVAALAKLAGEEDAPRLVGMLAAASDADDILHLQEAVAAAARRHADPGSRADILLDLMKEASPLEKISILRVLPDLGGTKALRAVAAETRNADPRIRGVAVLALARWPDLDAAGELLRAAEESADARDQLLALQGYIRLVERSGLPDGNKLELLRAALERAKDDTGRRPVLVGLTNIREPESFRLLSEHLGKPGLGEAAAAALLEMASSQAPAERWLSDHEVISILRRLETATKDRAERDRVGRIISDRLRQGGFVPLFNGRNLDGWQGRVADPPKRVEMTPEELRLAQAAADETMRAHWKVVDGTLVFDGQGDGLCTARDYGDFELLVDWKIEKGGDSGLYLRGSPQVQIWDAEANPVGSGGLYNNQKGQSAPLERADRPVGEWNTFRVIMIGERVTVYLNDRMVVDNTVLENYWERDKPIYPSGPIELQAHGSPLYFRNIHIREIPRDETGPRITAGAGGAEDRGRAPCAAGR